MARTWGSEISQYPEEKKETSIPLVVTSERGIAQTPRKAGGVAGYKMGVARGVTKDHLRRTWLECQTIEGESPVFQKMISPCLVLPSSIRLVEPGVNLPGPSGKAKYRSTPIANSTVRER